MMCIVSIRLDTALAVDRQTNRQTDRRTDGRTDGQIGKPIIALWMHCILTCDKNQGMKLQDHDQQNRNTVKFRQQIRWLFFSHFSYVRPQASLDVVVHVARMWSIARLTKRAVPLGFPKPGSFCKTGFSVLGRSKPVFGFGFGVGSHIIAFTTNLRGGGRSKRRHSMLSW